MPEILTWVVSEDSRAQGGVTVAVVAKVEVPPKIFWVSLTRILLDPESKFNLLHNKREGSLYA